jgi:glycosyltransferase involved in cell wall biosynthesis
MPPLVTVAIPTYNRGQTLADCLDSVLAQTYAPIEIVVVDDGSADATAEVLARYAGRITAIRQENRGISAARNRAARAARGEYVAWMDSDDLCHPDRIAIEMEVLRQLPDVVLVSSDFSGFDATGVIGPSQIRSYYSAVGRTPGGLSGLYRDERELPLGTASSRGPASVRVLSGDVHEALVRGSFVHPPTVLLRREAALAAGDLDEGLATCMEWDYFLRLSRLGPFAYVDRPLLSYRYSPDQISSDRNEALTRRAILRVVEKMAETGEPFVRQNRPAYRRRLAECHLALASALAADHRRQAATHLARSVRMGCGNGLTMRTLARLLLPAPVVRAIRSRRARARETREPGR